MTSLSNLKKNSSIDKLTKALADTQKSHKDDRFWQPEVDKAGNGYAMIRFLDAPAADGDAGLPFVQYWAHGFQGPGGWYIENSLTTLGKDDPVSEYNSQLWNSGSEANKKLASAQKRKLYYVSNILVVKDPAHPENEGKVFLFRYGKKIFDKIRTQINPTQEEIDAAKLEDLTLTRINVFNMWEGANFKLKIRKVEGYRNYDKSEFDVSSAVADSDAKIDKIWKSEYSLTELVAPDKFKTYEQLKSRLDKVLGMSSQSSQGNAESASLPESAPAAMPAADQSDEDGLDMFQKLAES